MKNINNLYLGLILLISSMLLGINSVSACARDSLTEFLIDKMNINERISEESKQNDDLWESNIELTDEEISKINIISYYFFDSLENSINLDYLSLILIIEPDEEVMNFKYNNSKPEELAEFIVQEYKKHLDDPKFQEVLSYGVDDFDGVQEYEAESDYDGAYYYEDENYNTEDFDSEPMKPEDIEYLSGESEKAENYDLDEEIIDESMYESPIFENQEKLDDMREYLNVDYTLESERPN